MMRYIERASFNSPADTLSTVACDRYVQIDIRRCQDDRPELERLLRVGCPSNFQVQLA